MIRVVKVGGSLFNLPDLSERLQSWLAAQPPAHHVLIAGGGPLVDPVRAWNAAKPIDETTAHWMCVDLLTVTARLLHAWLPEVPLVEEHELLRQRVGHAGATIFGPARWMRLVEPGLPGAPLPCSWDATSDAIAGRLAVTLQADELVLLKSTLPGSSPMDVSSLAAAGYVDRMLARMAMDLPPIRLVDLRSRSSLEAKLTRPRAAI